MSLSVSFGDIEAAHARLHGVAHRTPVLTSSSIDALTGAAVRFKCENLQRMGAFKFRGAYNALAQLTDDQKRRGVITYSSGNHAQAVALAGRLLGVAATIVMPADAPRVKLEATRGYGAEVITYDAKTASREDIARKRAAEPPPSASQTDTADGARAASPCARLIPLRSRGARRWCEAGA